MGAHSLVDLSGVLTPPGELLALTLLSWMLCLLPTLAYTSVAILFSVATRNGIVGVLGPLLVALLTQLLDLIGKGVIVHLLLIGSAFEGWHGLFTTHRFYGPLVISSLVSVAWIAACITASWRILRRRDFLASTVNRGPDWRTPVRVVAIATALVAVLALLANVGPTGDTDHRLSAAIGEEFNNLTLLQQQLIGRRVPAGAKLDILPNCNRRAAKAVGPGDWNCTPQRLPAAGAFGAVSADLRRVRRERGIRRLLQGPVPARVHRRPDDARRPRAAASQTRCTSCTDASTPSESIAPSPMPVSGCPSSGRCSGAE